MNTKYEVICNLLADARVKLLDPNTSIDEKCTIRENLDVLSNSLWSEAKLVRAIYEVESSLHKGEVADSDVCVKLVRNYDK